MIKNKYSLVILLTMIKKIILSKEKLEKEMNLKKKKNKEMKNKK